VEGIIGRRQFVGGAGFALVAAGLAACSPSAAKATTSLVRKLAGKRPAGSDLGAVEHVVMLIRRTGRSTTTICDAYHCSVLGPTDPNRLYWMSATIDPDGRAGGPVVATNDSAAFRWTMSWPTMPEALESRGISWPFYNPPGAAFQPENPLSMAVSNNKLLYFKQFQDPATALYRKACDATFPDDFVRDVRTDELPAVSWLVAPSLPQDLSEHPPAPPARGEYFTHQVLSVLAANPRVWAKTVLMLSYDENDGFFDHVSPPTPPPGTAGEYLTVEPLPADAAGLAGPIGLGMRVPMLVISPFSVGGHVCREVADHTSQLRFLETRFGVEVPNLSSWRRSVTSDLVTALTFPGAAGSLPPLPKTPFNSALLGRECTATQLFEIDVFPAPDLRPRAQAMPSQEAVP
jgi:phospholipase C